MTDRSNLNICLLAGETSGDIHGARVVSAIKAIDSNIQCWGMAGPLMQSAGCEAAVDTREMSVMGFAEVLSHLPTIRKNETLLQSETLLRKPNVIIAIDYPGFNLRFAKWVRATFHTTENRIRILGYISPQVWAWKAGRIPTIAACYDGLAVVFPFEKDTYRSTQLDVRFVGHPLLEELPTIRDSEKAKLDLNIHNAPVIALLPGSRKQEIERHAPILADTFRLLKIDFPDAIGLVPAVSSLPEDLYKTLVKSGAKIVTDDATKVLIASDAAAVASGTATLQTALLGTPMVVIYKTSPITFWIGKRVVKVPHIALANLVMGELVAPERIQNEATPERIVDDLKVLLGGEGKKQVAKFAGLRERLGGIGASQRVAEWAIELAKTK